MTAASVNHGQTHPPHDRFAAMSQSLACSAVIVLLVTNVPLFLCMPIIDDAALWNLHAQVLLDGGVPYRDVLETNPPGTLWLVASIRWLLGPSSVPLRAADLAIFGLVVVLLQQILRDAGVRKTIRTWTGAACLLFYFSISEWCHCQRDMWLMVPSLAWLWLRGRQVRRISTDSSSAGRLFGWSILEGLVLGAGMWIKPMVLVPAATAWLVGACWVGDWRRSLVDAAGLVLGGLIMGAGGSIWLVVSGVWPYFWETFLDWNPSYVAAGKEHWTLRRFAGMCLRLFPWLLLHLPALGLAAAALLRGLPSVFSGGRLPACRNALARDAAGAPPDSQQLAQRLTCALAMAFYLGWLVQAVALQHLFDYVHAPGVLLAILTCVSSASMRRRRSPAARVGWITLVVLALLCWPAVRWSRLCCWADCLRHGSSAEIRDRLRLMQFPEWRDLERVAAYLRERGVRDGDVCCFPNSTIHLYEMLGIRPPTRYVYLENTLAFFPERSEVLRAALAAAAPKYAVTDLVTAGVPPDALSRIRPGMVLSGLASLGAGQARAYPWEFPILFRSGRYAVHRTGGPIRSLELMPDSSPPRARAGK
ncbi:MAG: hypothetical protein MUE50_07255 [Pirellulaceae bacterium]|nr:hypothetical protein [Pirellulaceae bacterium]MCU0977916.1 hypothetical protein [Pirellulaceae bacterium]